MHFYGLRGRRIELIPAGEETVPDTLSDAVRTRNAARRFEDAVRLTRATHRFFSGPAGVGMPRRTPLRHPPSIYRDGTTKLLRCLYREIVIRFQPGVPEDRRRAHVSEFGLEVVRESKFVKDQIVLRDPTDQKWGDALIEVANTLAERNGDILLAAPNFVSEYRRLVPPLIPTAQWHLDNSGQVIGQLAGEDVRAKPAWQILMGSRAITIAILDDGVDIDHPALKDQIWHNPDGSSPDKFGRDFFLDPSDPGHFDPRPKVFVSPFDDPTANDIHGTPCAGLAGAMAPDGRAFGVAAGCQILPVKIFHASELASDERVGDAIAYAARNADILSCSWTGPETPLISSAIEEAAMDGRTGRGCAIFCATGNDGNPTVGFPANVKSAVAVGSSTDQGMSPSFSNFGPEVSVVAPSNGGIEAVFTTDVSLPNRGFNLGSEASGGVDGLYTNAFGGTSASVPIVAGAAAVVLSQNPGLAAAQLKLLLEQTADKIGGSFDNNGHNDSFGFGRVNLFAALGSKPKT